MIFILPFFTRRWPSRGSRSNELVFLVIPRTWTSIHSNLPKGPWGQYHRCLRTSACAPHVIQENAKKMSVSSIYLGWCQTAYYTTNSYDKCLYMPAPECPCEVKVMSTLLAACRVDVFVWAECATKCLGTWQASPLGLEDENTDFTITSRSALCIAPSWQDAKVHTLFLLRCCSHVAFYWRFNPVLLQQTRVTSIFKGLYELCDTFCFCPTAIGILNDMQCRNKNRLFLGTSIWFQIMKFEIWR